MPSLDYKDDTETYDDALARFSAEGKPREDIIDFVKRHNSTVIDLDRLPKQTHNWHDQGEKLSCWDAGHPMHQVWKPRAKSA